MFNFSVVVVLYKKHYKESAALMSLLSKIDGINKDKISFKVYVWNNSPSFSPILSHQSVTWINAENVPLPIIYNKIASTSFSHGADALMISDDDTDYEMFDILENISIIIGESNNVGCFIPKVVSSNCLVSPARRNFFKGYLIEHVNSGLVESKNLVGINSGIIINKNCYEKLIPLYNEKLNFYGTDTDFFVRYEKEFKYAYLLDSQLEHSLSEHTIETLDRAMFRWNDHIYSLRVTFSGFGFFKDMLLGSYILYLKLKLSFKYKTFNFFK